MSKPQLSKSVPPFSISNTKHRGMDNTLNMNSNLSIIFFVIRLEGILLHAFTRDKNNHTQGQ